MGKRVDDSKALMLAGLLARVKNAVNDDLETALFAAIDDDDEGDAIELALESLSSCRAAITKARDAIEEL